MRRLVFETEKEFFTGGGERESSSEDGERLPVFEESGSGVYQAFAVHSQSRNTGQEWSEVINDGFMFHGISYAVVKSTRLLTKLSVC